MLQVEVQVLSASLTETMDVSMAAKEARLWHKVQTASDTQQQVSAPLYCHHLKLLE